jgi:N-carbamoylputrescine amidase
MKDLTIAAVCMHSVTGDVGYNLARIQTLASEAAMAGADVVCFPEASVNGYMLNPNTDRYTARDAETSIDSLVNLSQDMGVILLAGLIEPSSGPKPYITHILTGPQGLIGNYRKTHLSPAEREKYQPGDKIGVFNYREDVFGVALCYETHFPEISTVMALNGAQIVFFPHASPRGHPNAKLESWMRHLPARAFDNAVFVVACNQVGTTAEGLDFPGVALVIGPDGRVIKNYSGNEEKILFAELKGERLHAVREHRMRYFLPERKPRLYGNLTEI